ncbi:MAG: hypothetical protein F6K18_21220 [Okeania sp. SIO2C2]|uniref:transposase n=1 Tax=Okeania sp. SIO2C2 TaxID=2607787 RepID=UPI0013B5E224|nr:transposase [Okeania sp. SIO2C2]NEP89144.1 hypothetical protein [Okeania sp. SIO2C2]
MAQQTNTNVDMSKSKSKSKYLLSNWSEYDASLKQKGSLTFWLNDEVIEQWVNQQKTGGRGASNTYSNLAIELTVILSSLFGLAGRQTKGLSRSQHSCNKALQNY